MLLTKKRAIKKRAITLKEAIENIYPFLFSYGCGAAREFKNEDGSFHPIQKMKCQWNEEWIPALTALPVSITIILSLD